jgi:hypothetical protein
LWQASSQPLAELQDPAPQNGWFGLVVGPYWKQNVQENHGRDCITSISIILIFEDFGWKKTWMSPLVFPWNKPQIARGLLGARSTSSTACGAKTLWVLDQRDAIAQIAHEESLFRSPHVMLHQGPERCRVVFTIPNWGFFLGILWSPGNGMFLICLMTLKHSWSMEPGECQWDGLGFTTLELYLHLLNWRVPPAFCFVDHVLRNLGHCSHFSEKKYKKCVVKPHRFFFVPRLPCSCSWGREVGRHHGTHQAHWKLDQRTVHTRPWTFDGTQPREFPSFSVSQFQRCLAETSAHCCWIPQLSPVVPVFPTHPKLFLGRRDPKC